MGKKRKSVATSLEEVDRTMYSTFCSAANSLSQLYSQAITQQKLTFHAGERNGLEKLYQWILRQQEEGSRVNTMDIISYLQAELDFCGDETSLSPRAPSSNQSTSNIVFSNALTSPVRQSLQNYHISRGGGQATTQPSANGFRDGEQDRDSISCNDSSMDMHADSPGPPEST